MIDGAKTRLQIGGHRTPVVVQFFNHMLMPSAQKNFELSPLLAKLSAAQRWRNVGAMLVSRWNWSALNERPAYMSAELSDGWQLPVAIACAVVSDPALLMCGCIPGKPYSSVRDRSVLPRLDKDTLMEIGSGGVKYPQLLWRTWLTAYPSWTNVISIDISLASARHNGLNISVRPIYMLSVALFY